MNDYNCMFLAVSKMALITETINPNLHISYAFDEQFQQDVLSMKFTQEDIGIALEPSSNTHGLWVSTGNGVEIEIISRDEYRRGVETGKIVEDHWSDPGSDFFMSWNHLWQMFKKCGFEVEIEIYSIESDSEEDES